MYVTKLSPKALPEGESSKSLALLPMSRRELAYLFDSLSELISVCRRLCAIDFSGKSECYRLDDGKYLLIIDEPEENAYIGLCEHSFIDEYGKRENLQRARLTSSEHSTCVCSENAAEILGAL